MCAGVNPVMFTNVDSCLTVSPGPMPQQYPHHSATLHPHPQHPQPSATPTGQAQQGGPPQHGGPPSHPAASPVQHPQHPQAAAGVYNRSVDLVSVWLHVTYS